MSQILRLGARGSPLSLAQTRQVQASIALALGVDHAQAEAFVPVSTYTTTGDRIQDRTLAQAGGKGLFTRELDAALLAGQIDVAVHSLKDLPTELPEGLVLAAIPPRADPRDALVARAADQITDLPDGAVLGTASFRRGAQARFAHRGLKIVPLRGNVGTRLEKLARGDVDATYLAQAGLQRLGLDHVQRTLQDPWAMPPAIGQGALAITCRTGDHRTRDVLAAIHDEVSALCVGAERAFLRALDGSCRTAIAGHAAMDGPYLQFVGEAYCADASQRFRREIRCAPVEAIAWAQTLAEEIRAQAGSALAIDQGPAW